MSRGKTKKLGCSVNVAVESILTVGMMRAYCIVIWDIFKRMKDATYERGFQKSKDYYKKKDLHRGCQAVGNVVE